MIKRLFVFLIIIIPLAGYNQEVDSSTFQIIKSPKLSVKKYFHFLGNNFIQQAASPFTTSKTNWLKFGAFALVAASVVKCDEAVAKNTTIFRNRSGVLRLVSPVVTKFGGMNEVYTLGLLDAYGFIFKNEKLKTTTLLATQAYLTSSAWTYLLKYITCRERPFYYDPVEQENEGDWHGVFYQYRKNSLGNRPDIKEYSSFPSGHTSVAFAVATVFAEQYRDRPLIPIVSYTAATLVGLSRISENKHWASDVFIGAGLGYLCGRQVVRNYHRLSNSAKMLSKRRGVATYSIRYGSGVFMPCVMYNFR